MEMLINKNRFRWFLTYAIFFFTGIFLPLSTYIFAVIFLALILNQQHSFIRRIILSWFVYFGLLITTYLLLHIFNIFLDFKIYALITPLLPLGIMFFTDREPRLGKLVSGLDIAALALGGLTFILLLLPLRTTSMPEFLLFLSSGEDNASHFSLLHYAYDHQTYAYLTNDQNTGLIESLSIYQQGLHINEAFITRITFGSTARVKLLLFSFYLQSAAYYALFIFMLCYLMLLVSQRLYTLQKNAVLHVYYGFFPLFALLLGMGIFLQLMGWGFQTQIVSYVLLLILAYLVMFQSPRKASLETMLIAAIAVCSLSNVWYFLLPIGGIFILPFFQKAIKLLRNIWFIIPVIFFILTALIPVAVNSSLSTKTNALNEPGGVYIPSTLSIILMCTAVVLLMILKLRFSKLKQYANALIYPAVVAVIFSMGIFLYQKLTIGRNEYYYYKSIYTVLLLGFILLYGLAIGYIANLIVRNKLKVKHLHLFSAGVFAGLTIFIFMLKPVYPRVYINNWFNHSLEIGDAAVLLDTARRNTLNDIVYVGDCKVASDYISNRWAGAVFLSEDASRSSFETSRIIGQPHKEAIFLEDYLNKNPQALIRASGTCLSDEVRATVLSSGNTVVYD